MIIQNTEETSQWDDDGGSQLMVAAVSSLVEQIDGQDKVILAFLGISLVSLWDDLPTDQKQKLLNTEAVKQAFDKAKIKSRLERIGTRSRKI